jgi:hypothetical protein
MLGQVELCCLSSGHELEAQLLRRGRTGQFRGMSSKQLFSHHPSSSPQTLKAYHPAR